MARMSRSSRITYSKLNVINKKNPFRKCACQNTAAVEISNSHYMAVSHGNYRIHEFDLLK